MVSGLGGQGFGVGKPGAGEQPGGVIVVGVPGGGGAFDVVGGDQALALLAQPAGQVVPLAQQAFQRDLHDHLTAALVFDHKPLFDERPDQRPAGLGQVTVAGDPAMGWSLSGLMVASHGTNAARSAAS